MVFTLFYLIFAAIYGAGTLLVNTIGYAIGYIIRIYRDDDNPIEKIVTYIVLAGLVIMALCLLSKFM